MDGPKTARRPPVVHPSAGEAWFRALPHARRAQMNREWRAGLARDVRIERDVWRGHGDSAWKQGVVFALCDGFCALSSLATMTVALLAGAALGVLLHALSAKRLSSAALGGGAFLVFELVSRGALYIGIFFWIVPAAYFSSYLGIAREER
jgi:hypothetical protein